MRALLIVLFDNTGSQLTTPLQQHLHLQNESLFTAKQLAVKIKFVIYDDFPPTVYRDTNHLFGEIWCD